MKNKIKKILGCFIFLILLIVSIYKCSSLLEYKKAKIEYKDFFESDVNYDVIFFGASTMYNTILPQELWNEYGISSYNWGYANTTPAINYYLIKEVVKYTNPKLLVIDMYGLVEYEKYNNKKYRTDKIEQQHIQFDEIPLSKNKIEAVNDIFDDYDYTEEFIWNFIIYHNRWNELTEEDFNYKISPEKGASFLTGIGNRESFKLIPKDETVKIDSVCYEYLKKILDYCEKKDIDLLLTYMPIPASERHQKVANSVPKLIQNYDNVKYINLLYENIVDYDIDVYKDNDHLNFSGAMKTTSWLGNYIKKNYELTDYSDSKEWKEDYEEYKLYKLEKIQNESNLQNSLLLLKDKNYDILIEIKNHALLKNKLNLELLKNLGINSEKLKSDTKFLMIENGGEKTTIIKEEKQKNMFLDDDILTLYRKNSVYSIYLNNKLLKDDGSTYNDIKIIILDSDTHKLLKILKY